MADVFASLNTAIISGIGNPMHQILGAADSNYPTVSQSHGCLVDVCAIESCSLGAYLL